MVIVLSLALAAGCAATSVPPAETDYYREQLALARTAQPARAADEAAVLRDSAARLDVRAAAEAERIRQGDETEGLLDLAAPGAREFVARVADDRTADEALRGAHLDLEHVLLAVYARNPDVAAARGEWAATVRMYDQATYLEDLLLRYAAFTRLATPRVGASAMREAAFPYPGLVALKGEMIDREVAMARETVRMRLRDALVAAAKAFHGVAHAAEELRIREEQLTLDDRVLAATRARVEAGRAPQAELLEMEAERAAAANDVEEARAAAVRSRGEVNTLLARDPRAPLQVHPHGDPPAATPAVGPILAAAARMSPEVRMARAEVGRTAAAIRMAEAMLFAPPAPGAAAPGVPMGGSAGAAMGDAARGADDGTTSAGAMTASGAMGGSSPGLAADARALAPRDAAPSGAPGAFGADVAWVRELRERHAAKERAVDEAVRRAEREVVRAQFELDGARRTFALAASSTVPLSAEAVEERVRLYEAGRTTFAELGASIRRHLDAEHAAAMARHAYGAAEAMLWMAAGARPEFLGDGEEAGR